jgi:hypothetical protein
MALKTKPTQHKRRYGHHQRRSKKFHRVYLPYLPMVVMVILSLAISGLSPSRGTLAYATSMNVNGLLQSTNNHRANHGRVGLKIHQALNSAAQAKANDMITRNYWSHNTPDGQEPWFFVSAAGYKYEKAGENLAYGFLTSSDTVAGWMNSSSHKQNMLDSAYTEVGFGFANSSNFNGSGQQTVVVAMYGKPQVLSQSGQSPPSPAQAAQPKPAAQPQSEFKKANGPSNALTEEPVKEPAKNETIVATTDQAASDLQKAAPVQIARIQTLTGGHAPWAMLAVGLISGAAITVLVIKHSLALRKLLRKSEQFVVHHPLIDSTVVGLVVLAVVLSRTAGNIL